MPDLHNRAEAWQDGFDFIEMFCNPNRKHRRNGMLSPVEFERHQESSRRAKAKLAEKHNGSDRRKIKTLRTQ